MNGVIVRTMPAGLRNGLPERTRNYRYQGTGEDVLTAWMDHPRLRPLCGRLMPSGQLWRQARRARQPLQERRGSSQRPGNGHRAVTQGTPAEDSMSAVMDLEAVLVTSAIPRGRASQLRRVYGIGEYLFIGGSRMTVPEAAARLGVTERTVYRYRAVLREFAGTAA